MLNILLTVLPIFIVILLGNLLAKAGMLDHSYVSGSNRLIFNVFLPVLLLN